MEDVDSRQTALASIKNKAEELIKQAGNKEDFAVQGEGNSWGGDRDILNIIK